MDGFPKVTAKYPEIQKDVHKGYYGDRLLFQVGTIFDGEVYLNRHEIALERIKYLDNMPNVINAHNHIFDLLEAQIKESIQKKKDDKVQLMVDQIINHKWN